MDITSAKVYQSQRLRVAYDKDHVSMYIDGAYLRFLLLFI